MYVQVPTHMHMQTPPPQHFSSLPLSVCFIMCVLSWHFTALSVPAAISGSAPLRNFPTDCLLSACLCLPLLSLYLCSPIWDGMPESPPFCRHDLNIVCPPPIFLLSVCMLVFLYSKSVCHSGRLSVSSVDQFITVTDLYRQRLLVWRHWMERNQ